MKKIIIALMVAAFSIFGIVYAATQGATVNELSTGSLTETTAGSDEAYGGNVTLMNLTATASTDRWQGYYGNVTGTLSLGIGTDIFYDFSSAAATAVYASQNQTFNFANIEASTGAEIDTEWGYTGSDIAANIYAGARNVAGVVTQTVTLASGNFVSAIFDDSGVSDKSYFAFGVNVTTAACFDGNQCDYELMVPADGLETYYFFVEI